MATIELSESQLRFLGACVKDRIDRLDESIKTIRDHGEVLGIPISDDEFTVILVRSVHVTINQKIEDALMRSEAELPDLYVGPLS